ncbi:MAG: hypothetical protein K6G04_05170 [Lachnospiraceae bacterium]|nr:hypothetical protein [Lachnospiraceae bacterium]
MKNIRGILLGELLFILLVFGLVLFACGGNLVSITWYLDIPSLLFMLVFTIPGLMIMGVWKDFRKAFSVGMKDYRLLELKNIVGAVAAAQKVVVYAALFSMLISAVIILAHIPDISMIGPNLAVCFLSALYAVILEFLLLPLRLNAERKMNEEMDFEDE